MAELPHMAEFPHIAELPHMAEFPEAGPPDKKALVPQTVALSHGETPEVPEFDFRTASPHGVCISATKYTLPPAAS
jgi:hypothetical protein